VTPGRAGRSAGAARGRTLHRLRNLLLVVLGVAAVLLLTGGWYFSGEIRSGALEVKPRTLDRDLRVVTSSASRVSLQAVDERSDELAEETTYGLDWPGGYGHVRDVVVPGEVVTRQLTVLSGSSPAPGEPAGLRRDAFPDPATALGTPVREVAYRSDAGEFRAWLSSGGSTTWAVLVHGRGASRAEMLRLMRTTAALGLPSLDITYRRDAENGGGLARFGQDEWVDVEAAVQYALDHGARRVVLVGASMGGGVCAAFLERSALAPKVAGLVLDAPMLDLGATIEHAATQRRLPVVGLPIPPALTWAAQQIAGQRFDLDSDEVDYLDETGWLRVPALVFHGTSDATVPDTVTRRLAAAEPPSPNRSSSRAPSTSSRGTWTRGRTTRPSGVSWRPWSADSRGAELAPTARHRPEGGR
jgi:pimeloyl-ACP methyl ester carboxylesterase